MLSAMLSSPFTAVSCHALITLTLQMPFTMSLSLLALAASDIAAADASAPRRCSLMRY